MWGLEEDRFDRFQMFNRFEIKRLKLLMCKLLLIIKETSLN